MPRKTFKKLPDWEPGKNGTNLFHLKKLFYLFQDTKSQFALQSMINFEEFVQGSFTYFKLAHPENGKIFLFFPESKMIIYPGSDPANKRKEKEAYEACFREIHHLLEQNSKSNCRIVFPIAEPNSFGRGHAVTFVLDYCADSKELTPVIYDSVGRGTFFDKIASMFAPKTSENTDSTLSVYLQTIFPESPPVKRIAYNHQNRITNKQCGLFSFRVMHHAIESFVSSGIGMLDIPKPVNFSDTEDSFLSEAHIKEILDCVRNKKFTLDDIADGISNIKRYEPTIEVTRSFG